MRKNYFFVFLIIANTSCIHRKDNSAQTNAYVSSNTTFWNPSENIPVCFVNPTDDNTAARSIVESTVRNQYEPLIPMKFTGWGPCETDKKGVHILIADSVDGQSRPATIGIGKALEANLEHSNFNMIMNLSYKNYRNDLCGKQVETCIQSYSLHEFGHVLGLEHENERPDSPCNATLIGAPIDTASRQQLAARTTTGTLYDPDSIMNYCKNAIDLQEQKLPFLSVGDKAIIKAIYSPSPIPSGFKMLPMMTPEGLPALQQSLVQVFNKANFVALGEAAHWVGTYHEAHYVAIKTAIEKSGYRVVGFELPWSIMMEINKLLQNPTADISGVQGALSAFSSGITMQLLRDIQKWNASHPGDLVTVGGFDAQQPFIDYVEIINYAKQKMPDAVAPLKSCAGGEGYVSQIDWQKRDGGRGKIAQENFDQCLSMISKIRSSIMLDDWKMKAHLVAFQAAQELALNNNLPEGSEQTNNTYAKRDAAMKQIWSIQTESTWKGKKQILWMHAWHASKNTEKTPGIAAKSIGSLISEEVGDKYKVVFTAAANIEENGQFHTARVFPGVSSFERTCENVLAPYQFIDIKSAGTTFPSGKLFSIESNVGQLIPIFPDLMFDFVIFLPYATTTR